MHRIKFCTTVQASCNNIANIVLIAVISSSRTPLQTRILHTLNLQRQEVRKNVYRAIQDFAVEYDAESARLGELNDAEYDYDPDEQVNLAKERWTLERATEKLKELEDQLKMDCVDLGRQVRRQEKDLTRCGSIQHVSLAFLPCCLSKDFADVPIGTMRLYPLQACRRDRGEAGGITAEASTMRVYTHRKI